MAVNIDIYKPSQKILDKLEGYRSKGSKVNVGENAAKGILHEGLIDWLNTHTHTATSLGSPTKTPDMPLVSASCVSSTCKVSS